MFNNNTIKKILLTIQAAAIVTALSITSCAIPNKQAEVQTVTISAEEQAAIEKSGGNRSVGWSKINSTLKNARDIGAYKDVYVISEGGKNIYVKEEGQDTFVPVPFTHHELDAVPVDKIAVGASKSLASYRSFRGVVVAAKQDSVYAYISYPSSKKLEKLPPVDPGTGLVDIAVSLEGTIYATVTEYIGCHLKKFNWSTWKWEYVLVKTCKPDHTKCLKQIDANVEHRYGYYPQLGLTMIARDGVVYDVEKHIYNGDQMEDLFMYNIKATKDIAADKRPGTHHESFATFHDNTDTCYYINRQENSAFYIGSARYITISYDGYLYDAYGDGIWRIRL